MASHEESHSATTSKLSTFTHIWIIDNFSFQCHDNNSSSSKLLESAQFSPSINPNMKFSLKFHPQSQSVQDDLWQPQPVRYEILFDSRSHNNKTALGKSTNDIENDKIAIYLHKHSTGSPLLRVKFWLLDQNQQKHYYSEKMIESGQGMIGSISRSNLMEQKNSLLPNDKLTICCEIGYITNSITNSQPTESVQMLCEKAQKLSLESYRSLMESGKHSDVVICVDEGEEGNTKEFPLHKMILSGKSSVFEAMFKLEMEEAQQNRVLITDVKVNVFELLIRFIYYGNIEQLDKYSMELMEVADKYDIAQLKLLCQQYLGANMSLDSVIDLLVYADMHNANELKDSAIDFIKKNYYCVVKSDKWKSLFKKQPKLFGELLDLNLGD